MISEGQAEPWETVVNPPSPRRAAAYSCPPERVILNYNDCAGWSSDLYAYLFWGAEYWLVRANQGDPSYLAAFARIVSSVRLR
jgi:hypothetical protein